MVAMGNWHPWPMQDGGLGLRLESKTPAEIALAVMADIVRASNGIVRDQL